MRKAVLLPALFLSACVSVPGEPGSASGYGFGLIAVRRSPPQAEPGAVIVSSVGGWATQDGLGIGYRQSKTIELKDAGQCRVIFLIENEEQLASSVQLVKSTLDDSKGDICVTG